MLIAWVYDKKETHMANIGLVGFGKAGMAVADVLAADAQARQLAMAMIRDRAFA